MIVVETSALIDFMRGGDTPASSTLEKLERDGTPFTVPLVCCQEVLQGARDEREWNVLREYLEGQRFLTPREPWATHVGAARIYYDLRRRGVSVRSTVDCWIAQMVLDEDGELVHCDRDFERIQRVRPLKTL